MAVRALVTREEPEARWYLRRAEGGIRQEMVEADVVDCIADGRRAKLPASIYAHGAAMRCVPLKSDI